MNNNQIMVDLIMLDSYQTTNLFRLLTMSQVRQNTKEQSQTKFPEINVRPGTGNRGVSARDDGGDGYSHGQPSITQQINGIDLQSPFRLPSDEEVFLFRENERQRKQEAKASNEGQKIWDKMTAANRTQLKHYKNFETKQEEKFVPKTAYNSKDKKIIQQALEIAKERQKVKENGTQKEPIVNLIEQKKEMFLVTMAHGIIEDEIQKLKKTSEEKELALALSKKMLEKDHKDFQDYLDSRKQQKVDAETRTEEEIKEKKLKEQETKALQIRLTSLRAEKTRNEEAVSNFKEHKDFLDKLAPKEWNDTKERKRKERVVDIKEQFIQTQLERQSQDDQESHDQRLGRRDREQQQRTKRSPNEIRTELERHFQKLVEQGEIDSVEEFDDDFEMYFKTPQQLVELFNDLEERNLFLISTTQDAEQNLEELKTQHHKTKLEQEAKLKNLRGQKEQLIKNFDNVSVQIKTLQTKGAERENKRDYKDIRKQIIDAYELFQNEINLHDYNGKSTLEILVAIELYLEKQLKSLRSLPWDRVEHHRFQCERDQKLKQRSEHAERLKEELDMKTKKNMDKIMQPSKKKVGRQDMFRSAPFEKAIVQKQETFDNEEEEDKKYFME